jgi:PilX N-terminal
MKPQIDSPEVGRPRSERGVVLIIALLGVLLLSALGFGLVLTTSTELLIVGNYRNSQEALYGAEAAMERALQDLLIVPDWNTILAGTDRSAFVDGPPDGMRVLPDGSIIDLTKVTNVANCGKLTRCSAAELDAVTDERPWGTNNPRWMLYAYSPMGELLPSDTINSPFYVITWVGDDPSENDGDPTLDGSLQTNPGMGVIALRSEAFGPGGTHKVIEAAVARNDQGSLRILSWRELR